MSQRSTCSLLGLALLFVSCGRTGPPVSAAAVDPKPPPPEPLPALEHELPKELRKELERLASKEHSAAPSSLANALLAHAPNPCADEAQQLQQAQIHVTVANLDDDELEELIVLLGPVCDRSRRSLILVIDRDHGRPFVRATRAEVMRWPELIDTEARAFEISRQVVGPPWSQRTWEPLRLRLEDDRLEAVGARRPVPMRVPKDLAKRLEKRNKSKRDRSALIPHLAALVGTDDCEWRLDEDESIPPILYERAVNLDHDPALERVVFAPGACAAPHGGAGGLFLFDGAGEDLVLADRWFSSFVDGVFHASSKSKTVFVQRWTAWGSGVHRNELFAIRVVSGSLRTAFSIPAAFDSYEPSTTRDLTFRFAPAGADFSVHYRGKAATMDIAEWLPALAGSALDRDEPYPILEFRCRVRYRWNDGAGHYERRSVTRVKAEEVELFTAQGAYLIEEAEPWLPAFLPEIKRRARTDEGVKLFVTHLENTLPRQNVQRSRQQPSR